MPVQKHKRLQHMAPLAPPPRSDLLPPSRIGSRMSLDQPSQDWIDSDDSWIIFFRQTMKDIHGRKWPKVHTYCNMLSWTGCKKIVCKYNNLGENGPVPYELTVPAPRVWEPDQSGTTGPEVKQHPKIENRQNELLTPRSSKEEFQSTKSQASECTKPPTVFV